MNNVELTKKIEGYLKPAAAKAKKFKDLVAVSISLISETPEDLYVAVRDGKILCDHYAYDDNNCAIEASAETVDKMFSGALAFEKAVNDGFVKVKSGDVAKLKALEVLVPAGKTEAKKTAAKAPAKKAAAPKAAAKPAAKAEAKPAVKAEAKPAAKVEAKPAAKAAAPKTEAKPAAPATKTEAKPAAKAPAAKTVKK